MKTKEQFTLSQAIESIESSLKNKPTEMEQKLMAMLLCHFHEQDGIQHTITETVQAMEHLSHMLACCDILSLDDDTRTNIHHIIQMLQRLHTFLLRLILFNLAK